MPCGKKRKRKKMNTHKRKKRLRANRHKKKARQENELILIKAVYNSMYYRQFFLFQK